MHVDLHLYSMRIKLNVIPQHSVSWWYTVTRALSWNRTFFRDPDSIQGTGCQSQIIPLESQRSSTSTYVPWCLYSWVSVNSIRRFICKASAKPEVPWHRVWEPPRSGQSGPEPHLTAGNWWPGQRREKKERLKMRREVKLLPLWFQNAAQFMKFKNLFCVALKEYFKFTIDQQLFLKMNCIFLTQCKRSAKVT